MIQKSALGIIWRILNLLLGGFFRIISVKTIGVYNSGRIDFLISVSSIFLIFFLFGINTYLSKNLIYLNKEEQKESLSNSISIIMVIFLLSSFLLFPILSYMKFHKKEIFFIFFTNINFILSELIYSYYIGLEQSNKANLINFLTGLFHFIFFYILSIFYREDLSIYFISLTASYAFIQVLILKNKLSLKKLDFKVIKSSINFYIPSIVYGLFPVLSRIVHKNFSSQESLFTFSTAIAFLNLLNIIPLVLNSSYAPLISFNFKSRNFKYLEKDIKKIIRLSFLIIIPSFLFIFFNIGAILEFLLLENNINSRNILYLISMVSFFRIITLTCGNILNMTGYEKIEIFNGIFKLLIFISFIPLSNYLNTGAVVAYMISELFLSLIKFIQIRKLFNFSALDFKSLFYFIFIFIINFLVIKKFLIFRGAKLIYLGCINISFLILINLILSPFKDYKLIMDIFFTKKDISVY